MRFSVYEFVTQHSPGTPCPIRLRDPASGKIIADVIGFDTETDSVSVLCSGDDGTPYRYVDYDKREEALVAQDIRMPFEVVDWYEGIDDEPTIKVHTVTMQDGKVVGEWMPDRRDDMTVSPHLPKDAYWRDIVLQATAVEYIPAAAVVAVATPGDWPTFIEHRDWCLEDVRAYCHDAGVEYIHNGGISGKSLLAVKEWHRRKLEGDAA